MYLYIVYVSVWLQVLFNVFLCLYYENGPGPWSSQNTSMVSLTILVSLHIICLCNLGNTDIFAQYPLPSCTLFHRCRSWPRVSADIAWARSSHCRRIPCTWTAWSGDANGTRSHTRRPFPPPCCMRGLRGRRRKSVLFFVSDTTIIAVNMIMIA